MLDSRSAVTRASGVPPVERAHAGAAPRISGAAAAARNSRLSMSFLRPVCPGRSGTSLAGTAVERADTQGGNPMRRLIVLAVLLLVPAPATGLANGCPAPCSGQVSSLDGTQLLYVQPAGVGG